MRGESSGGGSRENPNFCALEWRREDRVLSTLCVVLGKKARDISPLVSHLVLLYGLCSPHQLFVAAQKLQLRTLSLLPKMKEPPQACLVT